MKIKALLLVLLTVGCAKHVPLHVESDARKPACDFSYSADRTFAYCQVGPSEWLIVSKTGSEKAVKFVCPKDALCNTDVLGTMYRTTRMGNK